MRVPFVDLKAQYGSLRSDVVKAMWDVLEGMDLMLGPNVRAFEAEFAAYCQVQHAIGVASGTDALMLALRACGIGAGDEVITVANTFVATAEAIAMLGAIPVYVDVDPDTYTLDPACLDRAISERTRAIIPVHLYGQMADMDPIMDFARRYGLVVVEDACQAHGAEYKGRRAGSIGDAGAFSFSMSKNLGAYGDGGAVTTNSRAVAEGIRRLRNHGSSAKYEHEEMGVNSRLDELQAAVLRIKLPHLDRWNARRRAHAQTYARLLQDLRVKPPVERCGSSHVYHIYVIQASERERVRRAMVDRGVDTGVHYPIPIHRQAASLGIGRMAGDLRVTEELSEEILSLPMYPELEPEQLSYVASCLHAGVGADRRVVAEVA
jgi:dTDP-4-amino-4,6-dideoxygalactose transaminase